MWLTRLFKTKKKDPVQVTPKVVRVRTYKDLKYSSITGYSKSNITREYIYGDLLLGIKHLLESASIIRVYMEGEWVRFTADVPKYGQVSGKLNRPSYLKYNRLDTDGEPIFRIYVHIRNSPREYTLSSKAFKDYQMAPLSDLIIKWFYPIEEQYEYDHNLPL